MGIGESHLAQFPTTPHLNGKVFLILLQLLLQRKPTKSFGPISPICLPLWWSMAMIITQTRRSVSEEEDGNEDSSGRNTFLLWALLCILFLFFRLQNPWYYTIYSVALSTRPTSRHYLRLQWEGVVLI